MNRRLVTSLVGIVLVAVVALTYTVVSGNSPQLGLDLQGGFSVVLTAKATNGKLPADDAVDKAKDIIRRRIDGLGVAEPDITRQGKTVVIQLPGVKDRKKAQQIVGRTAKLQFRPVLAVPATGYGPPKGKAIDATKACTLAPATTSTTAPAGGSSTTAPADGSTTTAPADSSTTGTGPGALGGDRDVTGQRFVGGGTGAVALGAQDPSTTAPATSAPVDTAPATTAPADATGTTAPAAATTDAAGTTVLPDQKRSVCYQLGPVDFEGDALSGARAVTNPNTGEWLVDVDVPGKNKSKVNDAFNTCFNKGATCPTGQAAILLDNEVVSAPAVQSADIASSGTFQITGNFTHSEASDLALVLRYGALPVQFQTSAEQQVSATLGRDSLHAGLLAGLVGVLAVAIYMLLYYRALGLVVILGLSVWGSLMYSLVCYLSVNASLALTLSGITGIIVSVGTTVDSYVVYFERMKDDVREGRSIRAATERGFQKAFRTILTADVSSFIGAFLLWWLTVGPVRGFAFFLGVSTILDVIVAYFFTRPLVILLGRSRFFTETRYIGLAGALGRPAPEVAS